MSNTRALRKQEEKEDCGERKTTRKHDRRQPNKKEGIEHEMTNLPFRSWCRHCIKGRGARGGLSESNWRRGTSPRSPCGVRGPGRRKGRGNVGVVGGQRTGDESCAQLGGSEEVDGRMDTSKSVEGFVKLGWSLRTSS